ncbi:MAG: hypothetical protein HRT44_13440 [Bdellovibrionales bacterium]|nr:hypothetical protein [Bdellovibrionales bacterium]NQZ20242.1 hypothetical protein [Bdellovibrionales bacterium]
MKEFNRIAKITVSLTLFAVLLLAFANCSKFSSQDFVGTEGLASSPGGNGDIVAKPDTLTASVISSNRALDSLVSCLGTVEPNAAARREMDKYQGSFSVEGKANSVTAPMVSAMTTVAAEVCLDLINRERGVEANQRRIFPSIDFDSNDATVDSAQVANVVRRLSRSCWGRNETSEELDSITDAFNGAFSSGDDNRDGTRKKMLFLCTTVSASLAAYSM